MLPLAGITVVSLEQAVAAPFATRQLADLGARVIKIERPGDGDFARGYDATVRGMSSHFVWLNRSKESLTLDLKRPEATLIRDRLIEKADVFVQNLAPAATERLGLGASELRKKYPRLIICDLSGYGSSGPYRDKKAYDLLIQAEAGVISITGTDETPSKVGVSVADISCGMYAYAAAFSRPYLRDRGRVKAAPWRFLFSIRWRNGWAIRPTIRRMEDRLRRALAPAMRPSRHTVRCGARMIKSFFLVSRTNESGNSFAKWFSANPQLFLDSRFDSNAKRVQNRPQLDRIMQDMFQQLTAAEIIARLEAAQIASARLNTVREFLDHPQLKARQRWRKVESPAGTIEALLPPVTMENVAPAMNPVPALGQQTDAILSELGFDSQTIAAWRQASVI